MKKYINLFVIGVLVFSSLSLFSVVKAEDDLGLSSKNLRQEINDINDNFKEKIMEVRKEVQETREAADNEEDEKVRNIEQEREALREQAKEKIELLKQEAETLREAAKKKMEALKETLKKEKDEAKAKAAETRITGREKALERFDAAVERMNELKSKVDSQIAKLDVKKVDTAKAKSFVIAAELKLDEIRAKITKANTLLAGSTNQLSKENKTKLVALNKDIQNLIKEVHQILNDAVKSLKEAVRVRLEAAKIPETEKAAEVPAETNQ